MSIAVCVVSLPERHNLLAEALDSVYAQTLQPDDVAVGVDYQRRGEVPNMNRLIDSTDAEWVAFLHDDDLWAPDHLAVCSEFFDQSDVVVSRYELVGRPVSTIEPWHTDFGDLTWTNWIGSPSMVVARRRFRFHEADNRYRWNDWRTYNTWLEDGARFVDTHRITTAYRFFGDNGSWKA